MMINYQISSGEANVNRPSFKAPVLTDQNSTVEEVCYWMKMFNSCASRMGFSDNPKELFFNFELLLSGKTLEDFESAKADPLSDDNPTVVLFCHVVTEWKCRRGFRPFQAERVHEEIKHLQTDSMSVNTFASCLEEINSYLPQLPL
jgi:hypothetical protein